MSTEGANQWRQERRLEQEQKAKQLQDALETASTPEDRAAAAAAIYGPSAFKQHAENLFGRLVGRAPQPVVSPYAAPSVTTPASSTPLPQDPGLGDSGGTVAGQPAPTKAAPGIGDDSQLPALPSPATSFQNPPVTVQGPAPHSRAEALAGVMARGTTANQRALALHGAELSQGNAAQIESLTGREAAFQKLAQGKSPAEQRQIAMLFGMQPRMTQREYTNPDTGERQWLYPDEAQEMGWTATMGTGVAKPIQLSDEQGNAFMGIERDGKYFDGNGKQLPNAKPFLKPGSTLPKAGTAGGKNAYATLTKDGWRDTNAPFGILPDFKPMATFAQTGLYGLEPFQNPDGTIGSALMNRRNGQFKVLSGVNGAPIDPRLLAMATKNMEPALESDTRFRVMKDSEEAAKRGDQQAQLNILANHLGMTQGLQKGARITQTLMNEAVSSAPWLDRVVARGFHKDPDTGDYVFDGYKEGVTLTPDQIDQMVSLGQKRRVRQWQQAQQAGQLVGVNVPIPGDLENPSETLKTPKNGPAPKAAKPSGGGAPKKIKIGDKFYTYNGSGDTADLKNYTEVKK